MKPRLAFTQPAPQADAEQRLIGSLAALLLHDAILPPPRLRLRVRYAPPGEPEKPMRPEKPVLAVMEGGRRP